MSVLNVAGPPDNQLLVRSFQGADAADHGGVSVTDGERPFGRCGGVLGGRRRHGFIPRLDSRTIDSGRFSRGRSGGTWKVSLGGAVDEGRYDGKIMAYMEDATRESDALCGEIGLVLEDLFANVLDRDLCERRVFREAIHEDEGGEEEKRWRWRVTIGESYKPFSEEAEPEKEGTGAMSLSVLTYKCDRQSHE